MKKKREAKEKDKVKGKKKGKTKVIEDGIWGLLEVSEKKAKKKPKKPVLTPKKINPDLKYNVSKTRPELGRKVHLDNVVPMPLELLKSVTDKSDKRGQALSDIMLRSIVPSVLGLSSAEEYMTTVLMDGFGVKEEDIQINEEVSNVLSIIASLEIITALVKRTSIPRAMKKSLLMKMSEDIAAGMSARILNADKAKQLSNMIKSGIIVGRSQRKNEAQQVIEDEVNEKEVRKSKLGRMAKRR